MMRERQLAPWQRRVYEIVFEADTPSGKMFDVVLIGIIIASVAAVMLESVAELQLRYGRWFRAGEWVFTILFTIEYVVRLLVVPRPMRYARSFFGIVDIVSIIPTYLSVIFPGGQVFASVRALRLLRVFRVLKLAHHVKAAQHLGHAIRASRQKITVFLLSITTLVLILGSAIYLVESSVNPGFSSIPRSVYWAIVTLTTVGYGDITPMTTVGQAIAACVMVAGYAMIAVPTGIITVELNRASQAVSTATCAHCLRQGHDADATHCKYCGTELISTQTETGS